MQKKEVKIEVPPMFHPSQIFTDQYPEDAPIKLVRNGHTLKRDYVDPKGEAFQYADTVNDEAGKGGVIRLTPDGMTPRVYVAVLKENPEQIAWGREQKSLLERSGIFVS